MKMGLTNKREELLKRMPVIENRILKSKDGKYIVHKTIITDIKPYAYYKTLMERSSEGT